MEEKIQRLLANLNSSTLWYLPCFWDKPDKIQFRIGLTSGGPQIEATPETTEQWNLVIKNSDGRVVAWPILIDSDNFKIVQEIYNKVRTLTNDLVYKQMRDNYYQQGVMLGNLDSIVKPFFTK